MIIRTKNVGVKVSGLGFLAWLVLSGWAYARSQYYQGRIDARKEINADVKKIIDEFDKKTKETKEEA